MSQQECDVCGASNPSYLLTCKSCKSRLTSFKGKSHPSKRNRAKKERKVQKKSQQYCRKGKKTYSNKNEAKLALKRIFRERQQNMRSYYCKECKGFHLTKLK
jgi:hypothetical protein|tara:strand:- start:526 stop:831 length:306 start_codon:yes stop_codon:yes gene_type:complete